MKATLAGLARLGVLLFLTFFFAGIASAQFSKLDDLAAQLDKELKPVKPHLVAVADFRSIDGTAMPQGHYFAWMISNALQDRAKKRFAVANHKNFDTDLAKLHLSAAVILGDTLQAAEFGRAHV